MSLVFPVVISYSSSPRPLFSFSMETEKSLGMRSANLRPIPIRPIAPYIPPSLKCHFERTFCAIYFEMTELSHEEFKKSLFQTFQSRGVLETLKVVEV